MLNFENIQIEWLGNDTFKLVAGRTVVYTDPYKVVMGEKADLILITHSHFDHCDQKSVNEISKDDTVVIAPPSCISNLTKMAKLINVGQSLTEKGVKVTAVPAYNTNKFRAPGVPFHPKEEGVGYVFELMGTRFYHPGDSDNIPEMAKLGHIDVAFLPVSGTYVMTPEEAAQAVEKIKPKLAIPMHYGSVAGTKEDAEKFKELVGDKAKVEII